jgi:hypothetical protein
VTLDWAILPLWQPKPRMSDGDKYDHHNYQIILCRLQLLLCSSYWNPSVTDVKDKRKASEELQDGGGEKK